MTEAFTDLQAELRVILGFPSKLQVRCANQVKVLVDHYRRLVEHKGWTGSASGSRSYVLQAISGFVIQAIRMAGGAVVMKELDLSQSYADEVEESTRHAIYRAVSEIESVYQLLLRDPEQANRLTKAIDKTKGSIARVGTLKKTLETQLLNAEKKVKTPAVDGRIPQLLVTVKFWRQPSAYGSTWDDISGTSYPVDISLDVVIWRAARDIPFYLGNLDQVWIYQEKLNEQTLTRSGLMFHKTPPTEQLSVLQRFAQGDQCTLYLITAFTPLPRNAPPMIIVHGYHRSVPGGREDTSYLIENPASDLPIFHSTLPFEPHGRLVYANPVTRRGFDSSGRSTGVTWDDVRHLCDNSTVNVLLAIVCKDVPNEVDLNPPTDYFPPNSDTQRPEGPSHLTHDVSQRLIQPSPLSETPHRSVDQSPAPQGNGGTQSVSRNTRTASPASRPATPASMVTGDTTDINIMDGPEMPTRLATSEESSTISPDPTWDNEATVRPFVSLPGEQQSFDKEGMMLQLASRLVYLPGTQDATTERPGSASQGVSPTMLAMPPSDEAHMAIQSSLQVTGPPRSVPPNSGVPNLLASAPERRHSPHSGQRESVPRKSTDSNSKAFAESLVDDGSPSSMELKRTSSGEESLLLYLDGCCIRRHSAKPWNTSGGSCDVFIGDHSTLGKVALKRPRMSEDADPESQMRSFLSEARIWKKLRHPNILQFVGTIDAGSFIWLVSIFAENGTVLEYVRKHPETDRHDLFSQLSTGLAYLHSQNVVHGDLKSSNLLVSAKRQLLIGDFGLSKLAETATATVRKGEGSTRWMAPELFEEFATKTLSSDVYAYGIIISEILSGELPFKSWNKYAVPGAVLANKRPPTVPRESPQGKSYASLWAVAEECWDPEPSKRPPMVDICSRFELDYTRTVDYDIPSGPQRASVAPRPSTSPSIASSGATHPAVTDGPEVKTMRPTRSKE